MMPFVHRHVPFKMNDARSRKWIDTQIPREPQLGFRRRPFARPFPPLAVRPSAQAGIVGFHEWRGLRVTDPLVDNLGRYVGLGSGKFSQQRQPRVTMKIGRVRRIEAVFCREPPIAFPQRYSNSQDRIRTQKLLRQILFERWRFTVADINPDQPLTFFDPGKFLLSLCRRSANPGRQSMQRRTFRWRHRRSNHDNGR